MCIVLFAFGIHDTFPFILASNRDEFFSRSTCRAQVWPTEDSVIDCIDNPSQCKNSNSKLPQFVVCGIDLERKENGTWLGTSARQNECRFAFVTNISEPINERIKYDGKSSPSEYQSRGRLVSDFLYGTESPAEYINRLEGIFDNYPTTWLGFNLVIGTTVQDNNNSNINDNHHQFPSFRLKFDVYFISNRRQSWNSVISQSNQRTDGSKLKLLSFKMNSGIWGVSNGIVIPLHNDPNYHTLVSPGQIKCPMWPKVHRGTKRISDFLTINPKCDEKIIVDFLWSLLLDTERASLTDVPDTGQPLKITHSLSSIYVPPLHLMGDSLYGTRSSTLMLISYKGHVTFMERSHHPYDPHDPKHRIHPNTTISIPQEDGKYGEAIVKEIVNCPYHDVTGRIYVQDDIIGWRFPLLWWQ